MPRNLLLSSVFSVPEAYSDIVENGEPRLYQYKPWGTLSCEKMLMPKIPQAWSLYAQNLWASRERFWDPYRIAMTILPHCLFVVNRCKSFVRLPFFGTREDDDICIVLPAWRAILHCFVSCDCIYLSIFLENFRKSQPETDWNVKTFCRHEVKKMSIVHQYFMS